MLKLAFLVLFLFATALPAQGLYYRDAAIRGHISVIDWYGTPAICILKQGGGEMFNLAPPTGRPMDRIAFGVLAVGVLDTRPCAPGSQWAFEMEASWPSAPTNVLPVGGLDLRSGAGVYPDRVTASLTTFGTQSWQFSYWGATTYYGKCNHGSFMEWSVVICVPGLYRAHT